MTLPIDSLAVVLPRYGRSLGGGAEALTKALVEQIAPQCSRSRRLRRLEIWTTCAIDHRTWENHFRPGSTLEEGILVRRFPVDPRNLDVFIRAELAMRDSRPLTVEEQLDWMANSVNSSALYAHIAKHGKEFDALLFAPYLFATTFWGSQIYPDRSVIIPCLHNEHYAYQDIIRVMLREVQGLIFNAHAEQDLCRELCGETVAAKGVVVGMGFEQPTLALDEDAGAKLRAKYKLDTPYLLYSGRKETGKNLDLLINAFERFECDCADTLQLVLIGSGEVHFRDALPSNVRDFGFVSEEEKRLLMRGALALVQPSVNESFSIVLMESWLEGAPSIVHAQCAVTRQHVVESGGGLYFSDESELHEIMRLLLGAPELRDHLGASGREHVKRVYDWEAVIDRLCEAFRHFKLGRTQATEE
ncbi:MAG: glycosyltransferase family 4 protein, partial [Deltaproteobacteria bacterium]|nr:glycosyltransferase family 4 protein [Deltaproteobacteria bacterium]